MTRTSRKPPLSATTWDTRRSAIWGSRYSTAFARHRYGLADGFEGNAQTFRIVTTTEVGGPVPRSESHGRHPGRAVEVPWARLHRPQPHPSELPVPPRGAAEPPQAPGSGSAKFSAYSTELAELEACRAPFAGRIEYWQQTVEASVMDLADDIAYAIHDLQDFHRIGVLQHAEVAAELGHWLSRRAELAALPDAELADRHRRPGRSLESLRRHLQVKNSWITDADAFAEAVAGASPSSWMSCWAFPSTARWRPKKPTARFSAGWTARLVDGVVVTPSPSPRTGHVDVEPPSGTRSRC